MRDCPVTVRTASASAHAYLVLSVLVLLLALLLLLLRRQRGRLEQQHIGRLFGGKLNERSAREGARLPIEHQRGVLDRAVSVERAREDICVGRYFMSETSGQIVCVRKYFVCNGW